MTWCARSFVASVDLAYPLLTRVALNSLLPRSAYAAFFALMVALLGAYILRSLLQYVITYWGHTFGIRVEADIRRDLFAHLEELSFDYYDKNRTGQLMSRLTNDLFEITELAHHGPEDVFISSVTIIGALVMMYHMEWRLALVITIILPLAAGLVIYRRRDMVRTSRAVKSRQAGINAEIESSLSGIRVAKAFANETGEIAKFGKANESYKLSKRDYFMVMGKFMATMELSLSTLSVAVIGVGGLLIMKGYMDYVDLIAFSLYISSFTSPIRKLTNFSEMFANGTAGFSPLSGNHAHRAHVARCA